MIGEIKNTTSVSSYQPSKEIRDFTAAVQKDYAYGVDILNRPWVELNDRSIIEDENRGKLMFNAFVDTEVDDPNESWKWRGTRSMARNKGIAMHANLTANYLLPKFTAQNDNDEIDRGFSEIMSEIIEWMASPTNSDYQSSFLQVVFGMMTNPITYMGAEFFEVYQTIKERTERGDVVTKEVVDEVLSGFKAPLYSPSQILLTNAFERNIQKQRVIIKREYVDKAELEAKYGDHPSWDYVQNGLKSIYNDEDGLFYDTYDENHPNLVSKETVLSRRDDTEVCFIGGVYFGDMNSVENNPIRHRDNRNAPKYNIVPFGYSRIGEHFAYYKSMMNVVSWDNMLYDAMSEVVMNRAFLEVDPPVVVSGTEQIDTDVIFPKSVFSLENENAKVQKLLPDSDLSAGFNALRETERSINESTVNETISGNLPDASQKAYNVAQAQNSAKKLIGGVAKNLVESVIQYGDLMKDIAINHISVPEVAEIVGGPMKLRYRSFFLENKTMGGKMVNKRIQFDSNLIGLSMTPDERRSENFKLLEQSGYPEKKESLVKVNPEMFAKFKYLAKADTEEIFTKNSEYWQPVLLNLKQALSQDPYVNQEALTRKTMYAFFQSAGDELVQEAPQQNPQVPGSPQGAFANQINNKMLSTALSGITP